ncbi:MAG: enoyl-CoA hydratase/isomerase family protein [Candidatus Bathyarchaeales archaeon]
MSYQNLTCTREASFLAPEQENIAIITLNRPDALNSMNRELLEELDALLESIRKDDTIRAIVITGAGRAFSVGADLREAEKFAEPQVKEFIELGQKVFNKIENFEKPVIAAINGFALGGGLELALACDIRIAAEEAKIGSPEVAVGLIPAWGGCVRLAKTIGRGRATEMILTGGQIDAKEAERIGLVNKVVSADELHSTVMWTAGTIATRAPIAVRHAKRIASKAIEIGMDEANKMMVDACMVCFKTEDIKEGVKAIFEKRSPQFKGK